MEMEAVERSKHLMSKTKSICPECNRTISADIFARDEKVYISKTCPEHGYFEDLYFGDYGMYVKFSKYAKDGRGIENPDIIAAAVNCPTGCGLCSNHLSHTALANIVVTNRCDLSCWYCFFYAEKAGYIYEPSLEQIRKMVRKMKAEKPISGAALQLTGGEPTLREDLVEIIKIAKEEGVQHVQLNTDGINLARDPTLAKRVHDAGVNTVYLSFDGVTPRTNPKNYWEIPSVLKNARAANLGLVLVPTVIRTVNDYEVGDMIRFGFKNIDVVRSVNFQPVSLVGRVSKGDRDKFRITIPDVIKRVEEQTEGDIERDDWFPVPASMAFSTFVEAWVGLPLYELTTHFACGAATYLFEKNGKMVPLTRFIDIPGFLEFLESEGVALEQGRSKVLSGAKLLLKLRKFVDSEKAPEGMKLGDILYNAIVKHDYSSLGAFHRRSLFVGMMHFMDKYNHDEERVRRCDVHYLTPDNRIIPFCSFNVLPEWYRDAIQKKYSISIEEWERRTGKTLRAGYYKRAQAPTGDDQNLLNPIAAL
ncbi:MAG: tetraether lipid synthase Tes [Conexivisphaerales archaeon]